MSEILLCARESIELFIILFNPHNNCIGRKYYYHFTFGDTEVLGKVQYLV